MVEKPGFYDDYIKKRNRSPLDDFSGLSPEQMFFLMNFKDFQQLSPFLQFNESISEDKLFRTPVMDFESKLIKIFRDNGRKVLLTTKDNLKLKHVKKLFFDCKFLSNSRYYDFFKSGRWKINTEEAIPDLYRIRNIITLNELFFEQKKTRLILREEEFSSCPTTERFLKYLFFTTRELNWSYFYDDWLYYTIIQNGFFFSIYLIHKFGEEYKYREFYADKFLKAFPNKAHWFHYDIPYYKEYLNDEEIEELSEKDEEKNRKSSYYHKTFDYLQYFGFVDKKVEGEDWLNQKVLYKKSDFFKEFVNFDENISGIR